MASLPFFMTHRVRFLARPFMPTSDLNSGFNYLCCSDYTRVACKRSFKLSDWIPDNRVSEHLRALEYYLLMNSLMLQRCINALRAHSFAQRGGFTPCSDATDGPTRENLFENKFPGDKFSHRGISCVSNCVERQKEGRKYANCCTNQCTLHTATSNDIV